MYKTLQIIILVLFLSFFPSIVFAQAASSRGQISGWVTGSEDNLPLSQTGYRFIPELTLETPLGDQLFIYSQISLNSYGTADFDSMEKPEMDSDIRAYRFWVRLAGSRFEIRIGLQKINFGSAALFRPLRWFDSVDPRDPLKLTGGVYGLLGRYYFQNNANIWLWSLYGNEDPKGWEAVPTAKESIEAGGRIQLPFSIGEAAFTYHHRKADFTESLLPAGLSDDDWADESRFAFDIKIDAVIGMWFEGAVFHRDTDIDFMKYSSLWTAGSDYTFDIGNGLNVLGEFFSSTGGKDIFADTLESNFIGASANYPLSLLDQLAGIYYYDITQQENYLTLQWQRIYDSWTFTFSGFINPDTGDSVSGSSADGSTKNKNARSGNGFQIMSVFNY
ncbi:MAG: hypothetical protein RBT69_07075 [Spirochaetia bacterium]|nr:hypothetical protein [Spirochaetia bacterium]